MTATETLTPAKISEPGVYRLTPDEYHADPVEGGSLSSSGARLLLPPSCPARFRWEQANGQQQKRVWDVGSAAHLLVLGSGPEIVVIDADSYRTKAAKEERDAAYGRGAVPVLAGEFEQVEAMAYALRSHPVAAALFDPSRGDPEVALVWRDERSGVMCRALVDWLPKPSSGRAILADYKTCHSAEPGALARSVHNFGYHQQADWYLTGAQTLGLAGPDSSFLFVAQEKAPPYLVTIVELDATALRIGASRNRRALDVYAHCVAEDHWPPYSEDIELLSLPRWAEIQEGEG